MTNVALWYSHFMTQGLCFWNLLQLSTWRAGLDRTWRGLKDVMWYKSTDCITVDVPLFPPIYVNEMKTLVCCKGRWIPGQQLNWVRLSCLQEAVGGRKLRPLWPTTQNHSPGAILLVRLPAVPLSHAVFWYCKAWTNMIGMLVFPLLSPFFVERLFCSNGII